jgi:hypothetical protein
VSELKKVEYFEGGFSNVQIMRPTVSSRDGRT